MKNGYVSVIIPCYNGEKYIKRCFQSLKKQTYDKLEVIFVNDGSTDGTETRFYGFKADFESPTRICKYVHKENGGVCSAINAGLPEVTGEYLVWPDCDDWMKNDCIEKEVTALNHNADWGAVRSKVSVVLENDLTKTIGYLLNTFQEKQNIFEELVDEKVTVYPPVGWMVRSDAFFQTHPHKSIYAENRGGGQNYQMLLPVAVQYKIGYIDEALSFYLVRPTSLSHDKEKAIQNSYMHQENCIAALRECNLKDAEIYITRVSKRFAKARLEYALGNLDKQTIHKLYAEYSCLEKPGFEVHLLMLKKYASVRFIYRITGWLKRKISR